MGIQKLSLSRSNHSLSEAPATDMRLRRASERTYRKTMTDRRDSLFFRIGPPSCLLTKSCVPLLVSGRKRNASVSFRWLVGVAAVTLLQVGSAAAQSVSLGRVDTGATVTFTRSGNEWGMEIAGGASPRISQSKPARIEIYQSGSDLQQLTSGYSSVKKTSTGVAAIADIPYGNKAVFHISDVWAIQGSVLSVKRNLTIKGSAPGGFNSSVVFTFDPSAQWQDANFMFPGGIYGDPTYDGERSPGGTLNFNAHRLVMREDILAAPVFAISFKTGATVSMMDPAPRGDSTDEETKLTKLTMTDARFQFGAIGTWQPDGHPLEFGFMYPATSNDYGATRDATANERWIRRFHPISSEVKHNYELRIRFGQNESFRDASRNTWRWAWSTLNPPINYIDVIAMRTVLADQLSSQVLTINGNTAVPFVASTMNDIRNWNWQMVAMGFVGKDLECADMLLREAERDKTARGQKMRQQGLAMIATAIRALPTVPLAGTGFDITTGKPWDHIWLSPWLRNATEDMRVLLRAYRRERLEGRQHPEWLSWVKQYGDWLIQQQRADGSFPRRWKPSSNEPAEPSGTASYNPVPMLVLLSEETDDPKYQQSAIKAADYVWTNFGSRGLFIGGAIDNPNITDKEAGMLSMEAFLSLYESTKEQKWLDRAKAAGDFAESWIWIWNLPMPVDAKNADLHYKQGVPTVGVQGITAANTGSTDEYLDWAVASYAKLYRYSKDPHYLEVAKVLLHDTKAMVAMPGRQYDVKGIGWQQEHWRMGPGPAGRGRGSHRFWLPWVTANHLNGINSLEEFDPVLFKQISTKPTAAVMTAAKK